MAAEEDKNWLGLFSHARVSFLLSMFGAFRPTQVNYGGLLWYARHEPGYILVLTEI